jgi:hypothetical protein
VPKPEEAARAEIDRLLTAAGWTVCMPAEADIADHRGVVISLPDCQRPLPFAAGSAGQTHSNVPAEARPHQYGAKSLRGGVALALNPSAEGSKLLGATHAFR